MLRICLVADGNFSTEELVRAYGVQVLRPQEMRDPVLRRLCSGNNRSKMAAMWEGPFERFLYLDSDAIFWGDVLSTFDPGSADFFVFRPSAWRALKLEVIKEIYVDPEQLRFFDPAFRWESRPYFCTGAFAARCGVIALDRWLRAEGWRKQRPTLFSWTRDQGILNDLVLSMADRGELRMEELALQVTTGDRSFDEMSTRFPCSISEPPVSVVRPWILHFCGKKPLLQFRKSFQRPFLAFRLLHYRNRYGHSSTGWARAWGAVLRDEASVFRQRAMKKLRRMFHDESVSASPVVQMDPMECRRRILESDSVGEGKSAGSGQLRAVRNDGRTKLTLNVTRGSLQPRD